MEDVQQRIYKEDADWATKEARRENKKKNRIARHNIRTEIHAAVDYYRAKKGEA